VRRSYDEVSAASGRDREASMLVFFGPEDFETRFELVSRVELTEGHPFPVGLRSGVELCLVALDGEFDLRVDGGTHRVPKSWVALLSTNDRFTIVPNAQHHVSLLITGTRVVRGRETESTGSKAGPLLERLDSGRLSPFAAHQGLGEIRFGTLFDTEVSSWTSIDHALLPPFTSVGYHQNHNSEEVFVILAGKGRMKTEDAVIDVEAGDCILNPLGGRHGIVNHTNRALEFLNFSVLSGEPPVDVTDLGDDLSDLL
jgi:mannose-6-phosphate isomerase-like protein (cupin superfamily)